MNDPGYRRLRYVRYADDTLLGFAGPRAEAEQIKQRIATFLRDDLKLELSQEKTLITHARTGRARFLGYDITVQHANRRVKRSATDRRNRRTVNGVIALHVPKDVIKAHCAPYLKSGKPARQPQLARCDDHTIVNLYGARYRGIVQYYLLAGDVFRLNRLHWVMRGSLLHTLACKHRSTVSKMARKHATTIDTPAGRRMCLQVSTDRGPGRNPLVARFGGIPLQRQKKAVLVDREPSWASHRRRELIGRLLTRRCELCARPGDVQVHQVRQLADLGNLGEKQPDWAVLMTRRRRKTLVVCARCHEDIHAGQSATPHGESHRRARCG
ncbi:group II intron reverse transcriptase/maturase [Streptomyces tendae]|uniref:group II intron reverse transcriptase/maturase n=1 Tax=Streptomyces tendae TaxID=1932 RepID=UPI003696DA9D